MVANHTLETKQKMLQLPSHKLKTDVSMRWNSAYEILLLFLEQPCAALLSPEVRSASEIFTLNVTDFSHAEEIVRALKSMKVVTTVMSGEMSPTLPVVGLLLLRY